VKNYQGNTMQAISEKISIGELKKMSEKMFGELVKAVVDVEKEVMVVDAELHADGEYVLLEDGSRQGHLWGINLYPHKGEDWIEFDSMINLRPSEGNRSRGVDNPQTQEKIKRIVNKLVRR
jgi:hypothetical protein